MSLANLKFLPSVSKARKPKFDLHLRIYDLNNVPLVSGTSSIKWHLSHSIHAEHRGRTPKCPISNHRVDYNYSKLVPSIRIGIDKNSNLEECFMEFEVLQEFSLVAGGGGGGRDEKITLGFVRLNLSEYVEESEALAREIPAEKGHARRRSTNTASSPRSSGKLSGEHEEEEFDDEGVIRRHLIQDSKINSTLKIGILMVQVDGDRNYIAPPLKTAPAFGGIAGIMAGEPVEPADDGHLPTISKSRDAAEVQDMYRRALAASWASLPGEVPGQPTAEEVIEDIFNGGDGWGTAAQAAARRKKRADGEDSGSLSGDEGHGGTLRPNDLRRLHLSHSGSSQHRARQHHQRQHSGVSDKSVATVTGRDGGAGGAGGRGPTSPSHRRSGSREAIGGLGRERSESLTSLAPTMGSSSERGRGEHGFKRAREVSEVEMRADLIAWRLPGSAE